jgi:hypothetical protein
MPTRYAILPGPQAALLTRLKETAELGYTLYGGTAIALHLGHRQSVDFDFFSDRRLDRDELRRRMPFLTHSVTIQDEPDTWTILTAPTDQTERFVKTSFFANLNFVRVDDPSFTTRHELLVASPIDLLGHKLKVLLQRVEAKDYQDIAALLRSGLALEQGLGAARTLFGAAFAPAEALRALTYFEGGDLLRLSASDRTILLHAARLRDPIPTVPIRGRELAPNNPP